MVAPSQRREMAQWAVTERAATVKLACKAFGISQTCYRYKAKLDAENVLIADWLVLLTNNQRNWGFGLCFLYLRNVRGFKWNHKRLARRALLPWTESASVLREAARIFDRRAHIPRRLRNRAPYCMMIKLSQPWCICSKKNGGARLAPFDRIRPQRLDLDPLTAPTFASSRRSRDCAAMLAYAQRAPTGCRDWQRPAAVGKIGLLWRPRLKALAAGFYRLPAYSRTAWSFPNPSGNLGRYPAGCASRQLDLPRKGSVLDCRVNR